MEIDFLQMHATGVSSLQRALFSRPPLSRVNGHFLGEPPPKLCRMRPRAAFKFARRAAPVPALPVLFAGREAELRGRVRVVFDIQSIPTSGLDGDGPLTRQAEVDGIRFQGQLRPRKVALCQRAQDFSRAP